MGKIWMPGGGGGADLDVVTAGKPDVLVGKVIVDKAGEPLNGTMVNRGAVSQALGVNGTYTIPEGYHNGSGKVTQNIPIQGADVSGTDRAWATNVSCWEGVACLGVRNAHYLNGVNWIQGNIPNFYAGNIKKGVNIGGVIGAWEGYVANPTDWYYFGANPAGFTAATSNGTTAFESNQIRIARYSDGYTVTNSIVANRSYNLTGYSNLAITVSTSGARQISISLSVSGFSGSVGPFTGTTTVYIPLVNANVTGTPTISVSHAGAGSVTTYITRIWLL